MAVRLLMCIVVLLIPLLLTGLVIGIVSDNWVVFNCTMIIEAILVLVAVCCAVCEMIWWGE